MLATLSDINLSDVERPYWHYTGRIHDLCNDDKVIAKKQFSFTLKASNLGELKETATGDSDSSGHAFTIPKAH